MPKSTQSQQSDKAPARQKPRPDFPLTPHPTGRWCKNVQGKLHYFGRIEKDAKGEAALELWLDQKDDLLAGRKPRVSGSGVKVGDLCRRTHAIHGWLNSQPTMPTSHRSHCRGPRFRTVVRPADRAAVADACSTENEPNIRDDAPESVWRELPTPANAFSTSSIMTTHRAIASAICRA